MFDNDWDILLEEEVTKDYFAELMNFIEIQYQEKEIYPTRDNIFRALKLTNYTDIKVVIVGQDPYHGEGEAHGLAFSVLQGKNPPSLKNIFQELKDDLGIERTNGNLEDWAKQGVLLLNTALTVEKDKPNSHKDIGWEQFTNRVIEIIDGKQDPVVFLLWGKHAQEKKYLIQNKKHFIIESTHPSPFSFHKGFKGSKPFSKTNEFLKKCNKCQINW